MKDSPSIVQSDVQDDALLFLGSHFNLNSNGTADILDDGIHVLIQYV
jgi:hypothetical protein